MIFYVNNIGSYLHYSSYPKIDMNVNDSITMLEHAFFMHATDDYYCRLEDIN